MPNQDGRVSVAIIYDSGSRGHPALGGRTRVLAEAVAEGAPAPTLGLAWPAALVRAAAVGVLVAQGPRFVYRLAHAGLLPTTADRVVNLLLLSSGIVVPALLLLRGVPPRVPRAPRSARPLLRPFVDQRTVLLMTYRRDGTPVGTPVHIAVVGDRAVLRTWDATWKLKRIRNNPEVTIAPSTACGRPTGPALRARARILEREGAAVAGRALARKYPVLHGVLIPLVHRLRRNTTVHVELTPIEGEHPVSGPQAAPPTTSNSNGGGVGRTVGPVRGQRSRREKVGSW